jgi:hypothetical protein
LETVQPALVQPTAHHALLVSIYVLQTILAKAAASSLDHAQVAIQQRASLACLGTICLQITLVEFVLFKDALYVTHHLSARAVRLDII